MRRARARAPSNGAVWSGEGGEGGGCPGEELAGAHISTACAVNAANRVALSARRPLLGRDVCVYGPVPRPKPAFLIAAPAIAPGTGTIAALEARSWRLTGASRFVNHGGERHEMRL